VWSLAAYGVCGATAVVKRLHLLCHGVEALCVQEQAIHVKHHMRDAAVRLLRVC
jgi:hypothetical protein